MSALAGIWRFDHKPEPDADCARMLAAQEIYGPHDGRQWSDGALAMGRRLFRTLPEDAHDRQPLQSRDGRLTLIADVRLDNRDDLIASLGVSSSDAQHSCDAAIVLECFGRWHEAAFDRLVGDFAFALWDAHAQKLTLARDFLGQRPLHYHCGRGFFAFASMPKGLHALGEVPYALDEQAMAEAVALLPQWEGRSFFKDISRVDPAHIVSVTPDGVTRRRYWEPKRPRPGNARQQHYIEGLRHHLDQATQSRLRGAGGTIGAQLSAGFDSSSVTATAARLLAPSGGKVIAFTAVPRLGFNGAVPRNRIGDEGPLAAATAAMYPNIAHVLVRPDHASLVGGLDRNFFLYDRPIFNLANAAWGHALNKAARERRLNVMLVGQMGNMTLSYNGLELLPELLRAGRLIKLYRMASDLVANSGMRWRGVASRAFGPFMPVWLWQWLSRIFGGDNFDVLDYTAIRADGLVEHKLDRIARERQLDFVYRPWRDGFAMRAWVMQRIDSGNNLKGTLAGWGLDYRDPLSDKRLVEFCLSIPTEQFVANGVQRALAKKALADRLPQAVIEATKRGYQAADWYEGATAARADIAAELERLSACAPAAKLLDIERLKRLVDNWPTSGWERGEVSNPYRLALLRGIAAGHFLRKASGANH